MTAVEFLIKEFNDILGPIETTVTGESLLVDAIKRAKEMEDSQATEYAKWSMEINQLTGHFFTFLEWIKDEPKDETFKSE